MPRPDVFTPVNALVNVTDALERWHREHREVLLDELGSEFAGASKAQTLAQALSSAQDEYLKEQRDDVAQTRVVDELIGRAQRFLRSTVASIKLAFNSSDNAQDALRDIIPKAPSGLRNVEQVRQALIRARTGLNTHLDVMNQGAPRGTRRLETIEGLLRDIDQLPQEIAREKVETRRALTARNSARLAAVSFVEISQLAAEAITDVDPTALDELNTIYNTHNPAPNSPRAENSPPSPAPPQEPGANA